MHWIQFAALLCWSLTPQFSTAVYVPDASDNPGAWVPLSPGDTAPVSGPDLTPDENNVAAWNAQFTAARDSGAIAIWPGGAWAVNGVLQPFGTQWHATSIGDSDLDGLPDDLDPCPGDAANNSSWWPGGTWIMNGVSQTYGGQWHLAGVGDADNDGIPDDLDPVPGDAANNSSWWQGGTWIMNGVSQTFSGQWHLAGAGDADMDGIPDDLDPVPGDAANNSFYWQGGAFTKSSPGYGNIYHIFCSGWFVGAATDANGDGLPDVLDDWFTNPSAHGTLQQFPGGTFLIAGAYSTFDPVSYFAASWADADGDLLPDELDPFPTDAWNSTHYDWPGGDFYINGALTHFAPARYNGLLADADNGGGDGIPDVADPYPLDPANNSAFWQGGQFTLDFVTQNLAARWHRADAVDADNDSIPDDLDPYLNDAGNPTLQAGQAYWAGGTFRINGQMTTYPGGIYSGSGADGDADGLPDSLDAWPEDPSNNSAWWPGGTFTILGQSQALTGQWHRSNSGDQDGDAIPDDVDPYPSDANNGITQSTFWAGGTFIIDGQSVLYAGHEYTGDFNDSDGDGLLNFADPYPNDTSNNSFYFAGGEITLNNIFVRFAPGWCAGSGSDGNSNGVPDSLDDWFADPSPHGTLQTWSGGTFNIEGQPRTWPAFKYYAANFNDADGDTIPDEIDPYPADQSNNIGFTWPATQTTLLYGNVQTTFSPAPYGGIFADTDADTIPDQAESAAYLNDPWNGNDTDGDFIPDSVEVQYPSLLDRSNPSDAAQPRPNDGISYLALHQYNIQHPASAIALDQPFPARDSDADSMSDAYELRYALQPFDRLDALDSPANDLIFNFEKAAQSTDPATPIVETNYVSYSGGQSQAAALSHHDPGKDAKENDWDGDKISNIDELFVFGTNAREVGSRPSDEQLIAAITSTQLLSTTTLINFRYLVTPCTCSNVNCPHSLTCSSTEHGAGCVCAYACACSNNLTCPHNSTCVCTGNCFPPPPTCNCGGNICPITGCSCNGNSGNCTWTANCGCTSLGCPGKILGGFCTMASTGGTCTCGGIPGCVCLKSGCPTSTCTCGGTATCGGGPGFCPGCANMNCASSGCSCAGSGTCPSPPPPCNCGMGTCPGTTIANDGACSHFNAGAGACSGCCYCGHSGCPGGYCVSNGQGTGSCSCNTYCNGSCGTAGCPGSGCVCAYAGNCVPLPCGGNGGIPCGATNGVVSCPGAGCTCGGLSSLNSLSIPGSCVPPLPPPIGIEKASLSEGQFVVNVPDVSSGAAGTLDLVFKKQGGGETIARTIENQSPGKVVIALDEILTGTTNTPAKPFDNLDAAKYDKIYARWRVGTLDVKSADRSFDDVQINGQTKKVAAVEVLAKRKISNYFSPEWGGTWSGTIRSKGAYRAGEWPASLTNIDVAGKLLDALDPANEGLAMDGTTIIRDRYRPAQAGHPQVTALNGNATIQNEADTQGYTTGYICKPDVDQDNASSPRVTLLRPTSVAVKYRNGGGTDADRLAYDDTVYIPDVPDVHLRTVDDTGGLHGNRDQIDVWRGQGDETLATTVRSYFKPASTCLKVIPTATP